MSPEGTESSRTPSESARAPSLQRRRRPLNRLFSRAALVIDVDLVSDARLSLSRWLRLLKSLEARGWPS